MSIIAIKNIPPRVTMPAFVKSLANTVKGEFEALDLMNLKNGVKVCYVKLSERLDPVQVIEVINSKTKYTAYVPKTVPNLKAASKKGKIPLKTRLRLRIPQPPHKVMIETHTEILTELQTKYTGLYNLSKKTGHKLMEAIARTIFERLKEISETNPEVMEIGFQLSKFYRKCHPHFGDFQLILSTLHKLQDAAGVPRSQVIEAELTTASVQPYSIDNIPLDKIQSATNKYSERIIKKITEYVSNLDTEVSSEDPEEEVAKKKVREQLQKLSPYLPEIVKQVIANHFIPQKAPYHRVRMADEGMASEDLSKSKEDTKNEIDKDSIIVVDDDDDELIIIDSDDNIPPSEENIEQPLPNKDDIITITIEDDESPDPTPQVNTASIVKQKKHPLRQRIHRQVPKSARERRKYWRQYRLPEHPLHSFQTYQQYPIIQNNPAALPTTNVAEAYPTTSNAIGIVHSTNIPRPNNPVYPAATNVAEAYPSTSNAIGIVHPTNIPRPNNPGYPTATNVAEAYPTTSNAIGIAHPNNIPRPNNPAYPIATNEINIEDSCLVVDELIHEQLRINTCRLFNIVVDAFTHEELNSNILYMSEFVVHEPEPLIVESDDVLPTSELTNLDQSLPNNGHSFTITVENDLYQGSALVAKGATTAPIVKPKRSRKKSRWPQLATNLPRPFHKTYRFMLQYLSPNDAWNLCCRVHKMNPKIQENLAPPNEIRVFSSRKRPCNRLPTPSKAAKSGLSTLVARVFGRNNIQKKTRPNKSPQDSKNKIARIEATTPNATIASSSTEKMPRPINDSLHGKPMNKPAKKKKSKAKKSKGAKKNQKNPNVDGLIRVGIVDAQRPMAADGITLLNDAGPRSESLKTPNEIPKIEPTTPTATPLVPSSTEEMTKPISDSTQERPNQIPKIDETASYNTLVGSSNIDQLRQPISHSFQERPRSESPQERPNQIPKISETASNDTLVGPSNTDQLPQPISHSSEERPISESPQERPNQIPKISETASNDTLVGPSNTDQLPQPISHSSEERPTSESPQERPHNISKIEDTIPTDILVGLSNIDQLPLPISHLSQERPRSESPQERPHKIPNTEATTPLPRDPTSSGELPRSVTDSLLKRPRLSESPEDKPNKIPKIETITPDIPTEEMPRPMNSIQVKPILIKIEEKMAKRKRVKKKLKNPHIPKDDSLIRVGIKDAHRPMSRNEMELLKEAILRGIDSSPSGEGPNFLGYTIKPGWLLVYCVNNASRNWLENLVGSLELWEGASLSVIGKKHFPKPAIALAWIPDKKIDPNTLIHRLDAQNGDVGCSHWRVYHRKPAGKGQFICFALDPSSLQVLWKRDYKLFFNFKTIQLKIKCKK